MKPTRIDKDKIEFVGGVMYGYYAIASTSTTSEENHEASDLDITWENGKKYGVEVKTVNCCFNPSPDYLHPEKNKKWLSIRGDINPRYRYWMLNAVDNSQYLGKGLKMLKERSGLVYIFQDGILFFTPTAYDQSIAGLGVYWCSQRQQFEKENLKKTEQWKLIINLECGEWIPCHVPEEFFERKNYENFNKENSGRKIS